MYLRIIKQLVSIFIIALACIMLGFSFDPMIPQAQADTNSTTLTSQLPNNVGILNTGKSYFYDFAWRTFVALNWPSDCAGNPLEDKKIGEAPYAPRIWESYLLPDEAFSNNPKNKKDLGCVRNTTESNSDPKAGSEIAQRLVPEVTLRFTEFGDSDQIISLLLGSAGALVDKQGNYVINEIRINPAESSQIKDNQWYDVANLQGFNDQDNPFNFVCSEPDKDGQAANGKVCKSRSSNGAMEIKAAWRVFDQRNSEQEKAQYFTTKRKLSVINEANSTHTLQEIEVGLIGFHIMQKTNNNGWIWSTFEHIGNAPNCDSLSLVNDTTSYTLYNPQCQGENCKTNHLYAEKPYLWGDKAPYAVTTNGKHQIPSQICRKLNLSGNKDLIEINRVWQNQLENSVWQSYQLIGSQWLLKPEVPYSDTIREIVPGDSRNSLVNVTLEPYQQENTSCIQCHTFAKLGGKKNSPKADFSFLMLDENLVKQLSNQTAK